MGDIRFLGGAVLVLALHPPALATVFDVGPGDVSGLVAAIDDANGDGAPDTINLAAGASYDLSAADNGENGLPVVTSEVTIAGFGATIARIGAVSFRLFEVGDGGDLTLRDVTVTGGDPGPGAVGGGGIRVSGAGARLTLVGTTVTDNRCDGDLCLGGGIMVDSLDAVVTLTDSTLSNNRAAEGGGIDFLSAAALALTRVHVVDNVVDSATSSVNGGGIAILDAADVTIIDSTVRGNGATANGAGGGGISLLLEDATLTVRNSTISGNTVNGAFSGSGGGILEQCFNCVVTLINTTVSGNTVVAAPISRGGGLQATDASWILNNVTVTDNTAGEGGGLAIFMPGATTVMLGNTILAGNHGPPGSPDCLGMVDSRGYNLVGDLTGCVIGAAPGDVTGAPMLGPLAESAGLVATHEPLAGSPAIDGGNPAAPGGGGGACEATDARGVPRPVGPTCDIGAFEVGGTITTPTTTTTTLPAGCQVAPMQGCRQPVVSGKANLALKNSSNDRKDKLAWRWRKGAATTLDDFGEPTNGTDYTLCIYDESGLAPVSRLVARAPAGGTCTRGKPCWKAKGAKGFRYKDKEGTPNGLVKMKLKPGIAGQAAIVLKGKGERLTLPPLPLGLPTRVQLQASNGTCWEAIHAETGTKKNTTTRFKGKSD